MGAGEVRAQKWGEVAPAPVVGRIEARPSELYTAIEEWLEHLKAARRTPETIKAYRAFVLPAVRNSGWTSTADLTYTNLTGFMEANASRWKGKTYNRNLAIWRSLTGYLVKRQLLEHDPLALAVTIDAEDSDPARAATTDEARALLKHACMKTASDKRAGLCTDVYYATMFLAGCRFSDAGGKDTGKGKGNKGAHTEAQDEPATGWLWEHLDLTGPVPCILWTAANNKSRKRQILAMAPELATILRAHKARMEALGHSTDAKALVFPERPTAATLGAYAAKAGIRLRDPILGPFKGHSARKWFSTTLTNQGVPAKMVDFLMRHSGSVEARYYRPTLEEQAAALARLPEIWPLKTPVENFTTPYASTTSDPRSENGLTEGVQNAEDEGITSPDSDLSNPAAFECGSYDDPPAGLVTSGDDARASHDRGCAGGARKGGKGRDGSISSGLRLPNGYFGIENEVIRTAAELLAAASKLLSLVGGLHGQQQRDDEGRDPGRKASG